jgi:hypothetical protein
MCFPFQGEVWSAVPLAATDALNVGVASAQQKGGAKSGALALAPRQSRFAQCEIAQTMTTILGYPALDRRIVVFLPA